MHQKLTHCVIDYRNARYQGNTNSTGSRQGLGIIVDDDLSFYLSEWNNNLLNGQTLVYISHGKYIYGRWENNEPHGINVFRTGETVLVGQFENGKIRDKILVIFEKYNIIAVLATTSHRQQFQVISCGKLLTHDDLTKYIQMLDIDMPDNYFSLIKFVTSIAEIDQQQLQKESLVACPCEGENCYFGYRDGLAIVFNSNNGVVSVGQHERKKVSGFGGKFDGKKIQEGNFQLQQTITYQKKRPNNQIYTIFQKLHKRSLNFKNQYFDSKVKTLGDLQTLVRGNIQKIVNYNMKNGLREATAGELNDSLDYQVMDEYESVKAVQNRQAMYERQTPKGMRKAVSNYYQQEKDLGKSYFKSSSSKQIVVQSSTKRQNSIINVQEMQYNQPENDQTQKRTPRKESTVYYAKKSPIRFKEEDRSIYEKESRIHDREPKTYEKQNRAKKYLPDSDKEEEFRPTERHYSRMSAVSQHKDQNHNNRGGRSPMNYTKNIEQRNIQPVNVELKDKIPKFGGLELQETQNPTHKNLFENEVEEYKKVLQRSKSREKLPGQSLGKYLKRPNYEDIQQRRRRILGQFKQVSENESAASLSRVSKFTDEKQRTSHRGSIQIDIESSSRQSDRKRGPQSPCMNQKILSFTSQNDMHTENSSQGCLPLSLVNNERLMNKMNRQSSKQCDLVNNEKAGYGKKEAGVDRLEFGNNGGRVGKENVSYTQGSFVKYRGLDEVKVECMPSEKKSEVRRFYCKETERTMELLNMTKKGSSQQIAPQHHQYNDDNQFSQIQLKSHQPAKRGDRFMADKASEIPQRQGVSRNRVADDRKVLKQRDYHGQKESAIRERENVGVVGEEQSRRRKGYKYYFD